MGSGVVDVLLSPNNGSDYGLTSADLQVVHPSSVLATSPGILSESDPVRPAIVTVYTTAPVVPLPDLRCLFGNGIGQITVARVVDSRAIECAVPRLPPGSHAVHVGAISTEAAARQLLSRPTSASITVLRRPSLLGVSPSRVSEVSRTVIRVTGSAFTDTQMAGCRVFGMDVPAVVLSTNELECSVLPAAIAAYSTGGGRQDSSLVEVTMDGVQFVSDLDVSVTVRGEPARLRLNQTTGPTHGAATVMVEALDSLAADAEPMDLGIGVAGEVACDFNGTRSAGSRQGAGSIACPVPFSRTTGDVIVRLSTDGASFFRATAVYTYVLPLAVLQVRPSTLPETGASVVRIIGEGFINSGSLMCSFGGASGQPATWISEG